MFKDIIGGLAGILNKDAKDAISAFAMVFIPLGIMWSVLFLPQLLVKELNKPEKCWEVQAVNGAAYKVNTCTGTIEAIESQASGKNVVQPAQATAVSPKANAEEAPAQAHANAIPSEKAVAGGAPKADAAKKAAANN